MLMQFATDKPAVIDRNQRREDVGAFKGGQEAVCRLPAHLQKGHVDAALAQKCGE